MAEQEVRPERRSIEEVARLWSAETGEAAADIEADLSAWIASLEEDETAIVALDVARHARSVPPPTVRTGKERALTLDDLEAFCRDHDRLVPRFWRDEAPEAPLAGAANQEPADDDDAPLSRLVVRAMSHMEHAAERRAPKPRIEPTAPVSPAPDPTPIIHKASAQGTVPKIVPKIELRPTPDSSLKSPLPASRPAAGEATPQKPRRVHPLRVAKAAPRQDCAKSPIGANGTQEPATPMSRANAPDKAPRPRPSPTVPRATPPVPAAPSPSLVPAFAGGALVGLAMSAAAAVIWWQTSGNTAISGRLVHIADAERQAGDATERARSAQAEVDRLTARLAADQNELKALDAVRAETKDLRARLDEARARLAARSTTDAALNEATAASASLRAELETAREKIAKLEETNQQEAQATARQAARLAALEQTSKSDKQTLQAALEGRAGLGQALKRAQAQIAAQNESLTSARDDLAQTSAGLRAARDEAERLRADLADANGKAETLRTALAGAEAERDSLNKAADGTSEQVAELARRLAAARDRLEETALAATARKAKATRLQRELGETRAKIAALRDDRDAARAETEAARAALKDAEAERAASRAAARDAATQAAAARASIATAQARMAILTARAATADAKARSDKEKLIAAAQASAAETAALREKLAAAQAQSQGGATPSVPTAPKRTAATATTSPTAVAVPIPPLAPSPTAARAPDPSVPDTDVMLARGNRFLERGDVASARLFYELALDQGSTKALAAVARTYDPKYLADSGAVGVASDPARAAALYRRAIDAGDSQAQRLLDDMTGWLVGGRS